MDSWSAVCTMKGLLQDPSSPSLPLPHPSPCALHTTLLVHPRFYPVPHSLSFNTHRSGPSLLWVPQCLRSPITTQCRQHPLLSPPCWHGTRKHVQWWIRDAVHHLGLWAGYLPSLLCSVALNVWGMRAPCLTISRAISRKALSLNGRCWTFC